MSLSQQMNGINIKNIQNVAIPNPNNPYGAYQRMSKQLHQRNMNQIGGGHVIYDNNNK